MTTNYFPLLTLCSAGLIVAACETPLVSFERTSQAQTVTQVTDPGSGLVFDVGVLSPEAVACPMDRLIGQRQLGTQCPAAGSSTQGDWVDSKLFDGATSGGLARYCVYTWAPFTSGTPPDVSVLPADRSRDWQDWLEPDCNVVSGLGSSYGAYIADDLEAAFMTQVEHVTPPALPLIEATPVFVIDSSQTHGLPTPGTGAMDHGHAMGTFIRRMTCDPSWSSSYNATCLSRVATTLGLPLRYEAGELIRDSNGGFFGSQGDIAAAVYASIERNIPSLTNHRVLNLSVGWMAHWSAPTAGVFPTPTRAVKDALTYASCTGALIFAAAGNDPGGPSPSTGPMYPAAWEAEPRPDAAACAALGAPAPSASSASYQPLLYAVAGVDGRDEPLSNRLAGSAPRLVAPAAHAVMLDVFTATSPATEVYTGSSVAAGVASAAAAAVWAMDPSLDGPEVAQLLYDSGIDLSLPAEFCLGTTCADQHRISVCQSLASACAGNANCTAPSCPTGPAALPFRDARPDVQAPPVTMPSTPSSGADITASFTVLNPCGATVMTKVGQSPSEPCPARQRYTFAAEPWVEPQPGDTPCPTCTIDPAGTLLMPLEDDLVGALSAPTLLIVDTAGQETFFELDVGEGDLSSGAFLKITDLDINLETLQKASVQFIVDGEYATSDEVLLDF